MWQRTALSAIIFLSICLVFGGGILLGSNNRDDTKDKNFVTGLGLGLTISGLLGLMVLLGTLTG